MTELTLSRSIAEAYVNIGMLLREPASSLPRPTHSDSNRACS